MRSQKCSQCGTLLDISKLEKGSKFACSACGTVLVAGEAVAVKRSLGDGPAFEPRSKPGAAAKKTPARTRRDRAAREEAAPSRSRAPLFVGLGALVVAGVVAGIVMSLGDGGGPGGGGRKAGGPQAWWASISPSIEADNAAALRAYLRHAKKNGYDRDPAFWDEKKDRIFRALLKEDRNDPDANRHLGRRCLQDYPGFAAVWDRMNDRIQLISDDAKRFVRRYEERVEGRKRVWLDADAYAVERKTLDAFVAWTKELAADPSEEQIQKGLGRAKTMAGDFGAEAFVARPFIVFLASRDLNQEQEESKRAAKRADFKTRGATIRKAFGALADAFETRFRKPLGLSVIDKQTVFYQWACDDRPAFVERAQRHRLAGVLSFFAPRERHWSYALLSDDADEGRHFTADLGHAAAEQLRWFYSRDPRKKFLNHFDEWGGVWFTLGWAEYLGGGVRVDPATGNASFTGFCRRRVEHLRRVLDHGVPLYPLRDLVEQKTIQSFARWVGSVWRSVLEEQEDLPDVARTLIGGEPGFHLKTLYAQAWYLAYFLNEFEDGKYRKQYLELLQAALSGRRKPSSRGGGRWASALEAFRDIMGIESDDDWSNLGRQYERSLKPALRRADG